MIRPRKGLRPRRSWWSQPYSWRLRCRWWRSWDSSRRPCWCRRLRPRWAKRWSFWSKIWGWVNTYKNTIFSGMNIHKSQLFWCELQGYKVLTHCQIANDLQVPSANQKWRWLFLIFTLPAGWWFQTLTNSIIFKYFQDGHIAPPTRYYY